MIYLIIEFLDELVFGVGEAACPFIRNDLHLNYVQIGLALSLPGFIANFIEPFIFTFSDVWKRRTVILIGGVFFTISLFLYLTRSQIALFERVESARLAKNQDQICELSWFRPSTLKLRL